MSIAATRDQYGKRDGGDGEHHGCPCGCFGKQVRGSARAEGGLRALAAKCSGEIRTLAGLQQDNADEYETNEDVNYGQECNHLQSLSEEAG